MTSVPADCTIVKSGVVATSDASKAETLTMETSDYSTLFKTGITAHNYRYTLTIQNDMALKTWYVKPYLVYTDADGKEFTVYGELSTGALNDRSNETHSVTLSNSLLSAAKRGAGITLD